MTPLTQIDTRPETDEGRPTMPAPTALADTLLGMFDTAVRERRYYEDEWLKDLRQYRGEYESEDMPAGTEQSEAFIRLTRAKVRTTDARMLDLLFPGGGARNFTLSATPEPDVSDAIREAVIQQIVYDKFEQVAADLATLDPAQLQEMRAAGQLPDINGMAQQLSQGGIPEELAPTEDEIMAAIRDDTEDRAERMTSVVEDQLVEGRYRQEIKKVVHSGNLYGTGWLKGPMAERKTITFWAQDETGQFVTQRREIRRPIFEFVPIWDVYPYRLDASSVEQCEGLFQRYVMPRHEVAALARRPGFDAALLREYIAAYPNGNAPELRYHESELRIMRDEDQGNINPQRERRYELIEYTGWVSGEHLADVGRIAERLPAGFETMDFKVNVWLLGDQVVRAVLFWAEDDEVQTYHRYVYEEDETGLLGVGICQIMRDPQRMFNAGIRAMVDNMRWAAGPIMEINLDLADPETDYENLDANRVLYRRGDGIEAQYPAMRVYNIDSRINEFMAFSGLAQDLADEATALPKYTGGHADSKAANTAHGLSMLMSQSNVVLKEPVSNYDEGITKPFLRAMYHWNMQFNERDDIKGDYVVRAVGSTSLMAREIYAETLERLAFGTNNDEDRDWIKRGELNRERFRVHDLEAARFVRTDDEYEEYMNRRMKMMQAVQAGQQGAANAG